MAVLVAPDEGAEHGSLAERGQQRGEESKHKRTGEQPDQNDSDGGEEEQGKWKVLTERLFVVELKGGLAADEEVVGEPEGTHLVHDMEGVGSVAIPGDVGHDQRLVPKARSADRLDAGDTLDCSRQGVGGSRGGLRGCDDVDGGRTESKVGIE